MLAQGPARGWTSAATLAGAATSVALLAVWIVWEQRVRHPLVELRLLGAGVHTGRAPVSRGRRLQRCAGICIVVLVAALTVSVVFVMRRPVLGRKRA